MVLYRRHIYQVSALSTFDGSYVPTMNEEVVTKNNETVLYEAGYRNGYNLNLLTRIYERASLVPAAAVIPALKVYIVIAARDGRGHSYRYVRGEILGPVARRTTAKAIAKNVFINQERKSELPGNERFFGSGGSMVAKLNLKKLTEGHHQEWSLRLNLTQHGKNSPGPDTMSRAARALHWRNQRAVTIIERYCGGSLGSWIDEEPQLTAINSANCRRIEHKDFECTLHHRVDSRWYVWLRSIEGARPVRVKKVTICYTLESGCLRLQPKEGGKPHLRLNMTTRPIANKAEVERICWDPKDGELYLSRMKPEETLVEVRSDSDVQIDRLTLV
ncbi:4-hydroxy-3-methylbut-2-en-1-yl diphosphate synthase (flavodoxin) [Dirofilaria immitis]